jgi:hypothetical protein
VRSCSVEPRYEFATTRRNFARDWGVHGRDDPMRILMFEDHECTDLAPKAFCTAQGHHIVGVTGSICSAIELARSGRPDIALVLSASDGSDQAFQVMHRLSQRGVPSLLLNCEADPGRAESLSLALDTAELGSVLERYRRKISADDDGDDSS